jgi:L-rhamnose mutarotase
MASLIADVQVLPTPSGTPSNQFEHVEAAISTIAASGLRHSVHALGTTIEGPAAEVWEVIRHAFEACFQSGATKELMMLKLCQGSRSAADLESSGKACAAAAASNASADTPVATPKMANVWGPQTYTGGGGRTRAGLRRVCFQLQFEPSKLDEYLKDHEAIWPEMQRALVDCGWHNYSLFFRPDGFAIGYFETDVDFATACARMEAHEVNARWQSAMAKYTPAGLSPLEGAAGEAGRIQTHCTSRQRVTSHEMVMG